MLRHSWNLVGMKETIHNWNADFNYDWDRKNFQWSKRSIHRFVCGNHLKELWSSWLGEYLDIFESIWSDAKAVRPLKEWPLRRSCSPTCINFLLGWQQFSVWEMTQLECFYSLDYTYFNHLLVKKIVDSELTVYFVHLRSFLRL